MNIEKINSILSVMDNFESKFKLISSDKSDGYHDEKSQGEEGLKVDIYDIGEPEIFLKVVTSSDSYGDDEKVSQIQFVTAKVKTVIEYN